MISAEQTDFSESARARSAIHAGLPVVRSSSELGAARRPVQITRAVLAARAAQLMRLLTLRLLLTLRCAAAMLVQGATAIRDLGFGLLPAAAVPKAIVDDARAAVTQRLCELLDAADE